MIKTDGRLYVGEYRDGKPHGQGILAWPGGARIVGEFRDGAPTENCLLTWPNPAPPFVGERIEGIPPGFCNMHGFCDMTLSCGTRIRGDYWHGLPIGEHFVELPDGTGYIVMMLDDPRDKGE